MSAPVVGADGRIEVRCPEGPQGLFAKLVPSGTTVDPDTNLIEFSCRWCRVHWPTAVKAVLHRYNILGELVETVVEESDCSARTP